MQRNLKFGATDCLGVTSLSFIEIDDVPNGIEILADHGFSEQVGRMEDDLRTYVDLYVEILQVKGVFPNVNTDDGDMSEKRILVGCGDNLQFTTGWVKALTVTSGQSRHLSRNPGRFGE